MAITQTEDGTTHKDGKILVHKCSECGATSNYFWGVCRRCNVAYWATYSRLI